MFINIDNRVSVGLIKTCFNHFINCLGLVFGKLELSFDYDKFRQLIFSGLNFSDNFISDFCVDNFSNRCISRLRCLFF